MYLLKDLQGSWFPHSALDLRNLVEEQTLDPSLLSAADSSGTKLMRSQSPGPYVLLTPSPLSLQSCIDPLHNLTHTYDINDLDLLPLP